MIALAVSFSLALSLSVFSGSVLAEDIGGHGDRKGRRPDASHGTHERIAPPQGPQRHGSMTSNGSTTPYGDYCPSCSNYGFCKKELKPHEAVRAIKSHFEERGLAVVIVEGRGRFIRADITKGGKIVDRVVFDRKTGRLRPID